MNDLSQCTEAQLFSELGETDDPLLTAALIVDHDLQACDFAVGPELNVVCEWRILLDAAHFAA